MQLVSMLGHPRHRQPIIESQHHVHVHLHPATHPVHHPHHIRMLSPRRHKIRQTNLSPLSNERGLDDHRPRLIPPPHLHQILNRTNPPEPVLGCPQQRCKTSS